MAILTVQAVVTDHHKCRICSSICKRRAPGNSTLVQIHHPSTPAGLQLPPYQRSPHSNPLLQTLQHNLALVQQTVLHKLHSHFCVNKSLKGSTSASRRGRKVAACLRDQQRRRGLSSSIRDVRGRSSGSATRDVRNDHRSSAPPLEDVLVVEGGGSGDSGVSSCADRVRRSAGASRLNSDAESSSRSSRSHSTAGNTVNSSYRKIRNSGSHVSSLSRKISDTGSSVNSSSRKISDTGSSVNSSSGKISNTGSNVSSSSRKISKSGSHVSCSSRKIGNTGSSVSSSSERVSNAGSSVSCSSERVSNAGSSVSCSSRRGSSDSNSTNTPTESGHNNPQSRRRKGKLRARIRNRFLGCRDGISISVWNRRKIHKKASGAAFLGSVLLTPTLISQLRDTGYQQLELGRSNSSGGSGGSNEGGPSEDLLQGTGDVRGQLVVSLMTRDNRATSSGGGAQHGGGGGGGGGTTLTLTNTALLRGPDDLPEGWEERRSANGRVYYVDHNSRTTHWERPRNNTASPHLLTNSSSIGAGNKLVSSPKRHSTCFTGNIVLTNPSAALMASGSQQTSSAGAGGSGTPERTPTRRARSETVSGSGGGGDRRSALVLPLTPTHDPDTPNNNTIATTPSAGADSSQRRRSARHRNYLTRNRLHDQPGDLPAHYELRTTQQGQVYYYNTESGTSTWHDPRIPRDLGSAQHDSQLLGMLPAGWELRETASGRPYFLNHIKRTTQFTDPRLSNRNVLNNILRNRESNNSISSSVDSSNTNTTTTTTTNSSTDNVGVSIAPSTVITNTLTSITSTPPLTVNSHSSNTVVNSTGQNGVGSGGNSRAGSGANSRAGSPEAAIPSAAAVAVPHTASSATASRPNSAITSRQSSSNSITAVPAATAAPSSNSIVSLSSRLAAALSFGETSNSSDNINGGNSSNLISASNTSASLNNGSLGGATPTNSDRLRVIDNNARNEDNSSSTPTPDTAIRPRINNISTPSSPLTTPVTTPTAAVAASTCTPVRTPVRIPPNVPTTNIASTTTSSSSAITTVTPTTSSGGSSSSTTTTTTATTTTSSSSSSVLPSSTVTGGGGTKEGAPLIETEGDCLPKYTRDLVAKLNVLRAQLVCQVPQSGHCRLDVPRNEVFEESFRQISKLRPKDLKKRLMVKFRGEEGLDYGGVAREWLYLLSHEMLNPYYGLFQYSRDDIYTLQINPDSNVNPEHLAYFFFVGRVIGMAVFHGHYIDGGFAMPFYKMLLNKPIVLQDIEAVDPELYNSLNWILENDITGVLDSQSFTVEHDRFGALQRRELKPGGASLYLSESNKKEYVQLYVKFRFMQGIERQFSALQKGFTEVVSQELLAPFDERELELIIGGLGKIDVEDWKANTRLKHCTADTLVVVWFWEIVQRYSEEMRARLLQFVTGSSRVPLQGFKALQGSTGAAGPRLFTIHLIDANKENLPKAHTCFNRIDIPSYESYIKMNEKLTQAVEETCGFAVE